MEVDERSGGRKKEEAEKGKRDKEADKDSYEDGRERQVDWTKE